MLRQINKGYLGKWLMILNFILDWGIFAVGIWEIIFLAKYDNNCGVGLTTTEIVVGSLLCVLTFVRVYYILLILLFPVFILPCYYMPDCCPCKKCVMGGQDLTDQIWESLEESEWTFQEEFMEPTQKTALCFICLQRFKQNDTLMLLPCGAKNPHMGRSIFGTGTGTDTGSQASAYQMAGGSGTSQAFQPMLDYSR